MSRGFTIFIVVFSLLIALLVGGLVSNTNNKLKEVAQSRNQVMENIGGDLEIVSMDTYKGFSSSEQILGCFVFVQGTYEGKSETIIRFSWQSRDGYFYLYEVPASLFQRVKSSTNEDGRLTVNFNLDFDNASNFILDSSPLGYNKIIKDYSKTVTITMTDAQYAEFLKSTYSKQ